MIIKVIAIFRRATDFSAGVRWPIGQGISCGFRRRMEVTVIPIDVTERWTFTAARFFNAGGNARAVDNSPPVLWGETIP